MALSDETLDRLIADDKAEEESLLAQIQSYENGEFFTQSRSGDGPWTDSTQSELKNCRQHFEMVQTRLNRYAELKTDRANG